MQISVDDNMSLYGSPTNYGDGDGFDSNKLQSGIDGSSETPNIDVAP